VYGVITYCWNTSMGKSGIVVIPPVGSSPDMANSRKWATVCGARSRSTMLTLEHVWALMLSKLCFSLHYEENLNGQSILATGHKKCPALLSFLAICWINICASSPIAHLEVLTCQTWLPTYQSSAYHPNRLHFRLLVQIPADRGEDSSAIRDLSLL